jgi:protoheme ferro-lyase
MFEIMVDGWPWQDSQGAEAWTEPEALSLMELLERQGFEDIKMVPCDG